MVTLQEAKDYLRITTTDKDTWISTLISASANFIKAFTGTDFTYQQATEKIFDGTGESYLLLDSPVSNITSIVIDNTSYDISDFYVDDLYYLYAKSNIFTEGTQNVKITADWGYQTWPDDLKLAQLMLITFFYQKDKDELNVISKVYQGMSTVFVQDIPPVVIHLLRFYARRAM